MKIKISLLLCIAVLMHINTNQLEAKWIKIKSASGISVYKNEDPNNNNLVFKGKGVVQKEMFLIIAIIGDVKNITKWIETLNSATLVKEYNDRELVLYNVIHAPWPFQNRDVVIHTKLTYDYKNDWIHIAGKNITLPNYPVKSGIVRIPYMRSSWSLKPINNGKSTWVEFKVQADPGGVIPAWLSNLTSKDVPYKTIMNLRRRVRQGKFSKSVLIKIDRFAKKNNLYERYKKKFGTQYIQSVSHYEKTYKLVP